MRLCNAGLVSGFRVPGAVHFVWVRKLEAGDDGQRGSGSNDALAANGSAAGTGASRAWASGGMLALAAMQGFVRADVEISLCVSCGDFSDVSEPRGRWVCAASVGAGGDERGGRVDRRGIQFVGTHVVYPHAGYGTTKVFQLVLNLTNPLGWAPFVLFMLPWGWLVVTLAGSGLVQRLRQRRWLRVGGLRGDVAGGGTDGGGSHLYAVCHGVDSADMWVRDAEVSRAGGRLACGWVG